MQILLSNALPADVQSTGVFQLTDLSQQGTTAAPGDIQPVFLGLIVEALPWVFRIAMGASFIWLGTDLEAAKNKLTASGIPYRETSSTTLYLVAAIGGMVAAIIFIKFLRWGKK